MWLMRALRCFQRFILHSNFSSVRRLPTMRPQQDFSRSFCSCCCPPLLSCSFFVPLGLLSHYLSTSLVVFLCFLFPPLVRIALLPVVCFPPSLLRARTTSALFFVARISLVDDLNGLAPIPVGRDSPLPLQGSPVNVVICNCTCICVYHVEVS